MPTTTEKNDKLQARAQEIANGYRLIIEPSRGGGFIGRALELPKVLARANTQDQCLTELRGILADTVLKILELRRVPPRPAETRLTEQVNVRLTPEEKLKAETLAQAGGYRGLSDFVRAVLMRQIRDSE